MEGTAISVRLLSGKVAFVPAGELGRASLQASIEGGSCVLVVLEEKGVERAGDMIPPGTSADCDCDSAPSRTREKVLLSDEMAIRLRRLDNGRGWLMVDAGDAGSPKPLLLGLVIGCRVDALIAVILLETSDGDRNPGAIGWEGSRAPKGAEG